MTAQNNVTLTLEGPQPGASVYSALERPRGILKVPTSQGELSFSISNLRHLFMLLQELAQKREERFITETDLKQVEYETCMKAVADTYDGDQEVSSIKNLLGVSVKTRWLSYGSIACSVAGVTLSAIPRLSDALFGIKDLHIGNVDLRNTKILERREGVIKTIQSMSEGVFGSLKSVQGSDDEAKRKAKEAQSTVSQMQLQDAQRGSERAKKHSDDDAQSIDQIQQGLTAVAQQIARGG